MPTAPLPFGERRFLALYSGVAGFVDTAGFVALAGLFTAHVTGNLVLAGAALSEPHSLGLLPKLLMLPIFMAGIWIAAVLVDRTRDGNASPARVLLFAQAVGLLAFVAVGITLGPSGGAPLTSVWRITVLGAVGVVAMAFQNAFMREIVPTLPATTVMTGNLTQVTLDLVRQISRPSPERQARLARQGPAVVGFLVGAAAGALGILHLGFGSLAIPTAVVALLAVRCDPPSNS